MILVGLKNKLMLVQDITNFINSFYLVNVQEEIWCLTLAHESKIINYEYIF